MKSLSLTLVILWLLISGCNQSGDKKSNFEDNHTPFLQLPGSFSIQNSSKSTTEFTISWQSSNNTDAYSLFYYRETTPGNQQQIDNVSSPHTITGLIPGESYFVYLRSINRFGYIESNKIKITLDSSGGTPQELIFSTSPSTSGSTDQILTQQPVIDLVDQNGSRIQSYSATIELHAYSDSTCSTEILNSLENNSSAMVNGRASFTSLKVIKTSIQSIKATDGTYSTECLNGISISPGALASITLSQAPAPVSTTAGSVFTTQPKVTAYDAQNNIIITDSTSTVTLTPYDDVDCNGSSVASGLGGTLTQTLSSGVATFAGIYTQKISVKSIKAGLGALSTCSATLTVAPGAAASANTTISSTSNIVADGTSTATVTVTLLDAYSNPISGTTPTISSTGSNNTISACSSSNTSGISTCTISSTKAEVKTLAITSPATMTDTTNSTFIAGTAAVSKSSIALGLGTANNTASITVTITLKDIYENAIEGTTPSFDIVDGLGTYTIVSPCSATDSSGVSTCTFKTFRGKERIVRVTSPAGLTAVTAKNNLTCSIASFFTLAGSGTSGSPYEISTPQQLDQIRCSGGHYFKMMADIDLANYEWVTNDYTNNVNIDGNNKTISNLNINMNLNEYAAAGSSRDLASFLGNSAGNSLHFREIKDLTFSSPVVVASGVSFNDDAGQASVVCGNCIYRFININVTNGYVEGADYTGGLILVLRTGTEYSPAYPNQFGELTNSSFSGTVKIPASAASRYAYRWASGGLVGRVADGGAVISNNIFEGEITNEEIPENAQQSIGGIVGRYEMTYDSLVAGTDPKIFNNIVRNSRIANKTTDLGGVVGYIRVMQPGKQIYLENNRVENTEIENFSLGGGVANMGGIAGRIVQETANVSYLNKELIFRYNSASGLEIYSDYANMSAGGLIGRISGVDIYDNFINDSQVTLINNSSTRYFGGLVGTINQYTAGVTNVITRLTRNYSAVTISAWSPTNTEVKGLVGRKSVTAAGTTYTVDLTSDDNYFDITTSGLSEIAPYDNNGLSTTDMQNTTFPGWDNTTIWLFTPNTYPTLR